MLRVGSDADFVLVDAEHEWIIRDENVVSKYGRTSYDGMDVVGRPESTYVCGVPVVENRTVVGEPGHGEFITR